VPKQFAAEAVSAGCNPNGTNSLIHELEPEASSPSQTQPEDFVISAI
jgi:hypothetical protein